MTKLNSEDGRLLARHMVFGSCGIYVLRMFQDTNEGAFRARFICI